MFPSSHPGRQEPGFPLQSRVYRIFAASLAESCRGLARRLQAPSYGASCVQPRRSHMNAQTLSSSLCSSARPSWSASVGARTRPSSSSASAKPASRAHHRPSERPARPGRDRAAQGAGATAAASCRGPALRAGRHAAGRRRTAAAPAPPSATSAGADRRHHAPRRAATTSTSTRRRPRGRRRRR